MGGRVVHLDYNISSGPFLIMNFEFDQDHGPRPGFVWKNPLRFYPAGLIQINPPGKSQKNPPGGGFF